MRREQPSPNLAPRSCLPQSKPAWFPWQPQSHFFPIDKAGKERLCSDGTGLRWKWRREWGWAAPYDETQSDRTNSASLKTSNHPPSRLCLSHFSAKPDSKHLIKPILPFSPTYCALLFNIFAKCPWYFCNSSILIKGGGFLIKAKWQITVAELSRSLFNQRIVEKEKAITEWIKAGICKEMSGWEKGYLSHWLKPLIWSWL